jgi:hypothetical protein
LDDRVSYDARQVVLNAGAAIIDTAVSLSTRVPPQATDFDLNIESWGVTADGTGAAISVLHLGFLSGTDAHQLVTDFAVSPSTATRIPTGDVPEPLAAILLSSPSAQRERAIGDRGGAVLSRAERGLRQITVSSAVGKIAYMHDRHVSRSPDFAAAIETPTAIKRNVLAEWRLSGIGWSNSEEAVKDLSIEWILEGSPLPDHQFKCIAPDKHGTESKALYFDEWLIRCLRRDNYPVLSRQKRLLRRGALRESFVNSVGMKSPSSRNRADDSLIGG